MANLYHSEHDEALITYPLPIAEDGNKKLWIINSCQIWAINYESALELAYMAQAAHEDITSFA
jgi:hypothetical protein